MTQKDRVVEFIDQHGGITTVDAFKIGITQLGTRIFELKEIGYKFSTPKIRGTRLVRYTITDRPSLRLF